MTPPSEAAARTTGAAVLRSASWTTASLILPQFYFAATSVIIARFLLPEAMGRHAFIAFVSLALIMLLPGGLPFAVQRFAAEALGSGHPEHVPPLLGWSRRIAVVSAAGAATALTVVGLLGHEPQAAWILAGGVSALRILQTIPAASLAAQQQWRGISITLISLGAATPLGIFVALAAGGGITSIFAVEFVVATVSLVVTSTLARRALRSLGVRPVPSVELRRRTRRWALIATFSTALSFVVWQRSELFLLGWFSDDAQIAMYTIAFAAMLAVTRLPEAVGAVVASAFATLFGAGQIDRIRSGYARSVRLVLLIALPMTAATAMLGPIAVRVVYGSAYREAGTLLVIMAPTLPVLSLVSVSRSLIFGLGRQKVLVGVGIVAAAINLSLAFLLIPAYDAVGAAIANASAQLAAAGGYVAYGRRALGPLHWAPRSLLRNGVASAGAGAAALTVALALAPGPGLVAGLVVFAAVYVLLASVLRPIDAADGAWLLEVVTSRLSGTPAALLRRILVAATALR